MLKTQVLPVGAQFLDRDAVRKRNCMAIMLPECIQHVAGILPTRAEQTCAESGKSIIFVQ